MSRIGKKPVAIPKGVKVTVANNTVMFEGSKGKLQHSIPDRISVEIKDENIIVSSVSNSKMDKTFKGTTRAIIANMVKGVSEGYVRQLDIIGVGFRASMQGKNLSLQLGFSHPVVYTPLEGVTVESPKPTQIFVKGIDKVKVGQVSAEIRRILPPEPYKGKGIRYTGEHVRKKLGKAISKAG